MVKYRGIPHIKAGAALMCGRLSADKQSKEIWQLEHGKTKGTGNNARLGLLDALRGLALINMAAYHFIWDMVYIFGVDMPWYTSVWGQLWQRLICCTFIMISGFCLALSSRPGYRRGLLVLACGFGISAVMGVATPDLPNLFGVLTLLGSCMLLGAWGRRLFDRIRPVYGMASCFILFVLTYGINDGYIGLGAFALRLPRGLYSNLLTAYLGFPSDTFLSTDYFPILPWAFLFFAGYFLCRYIRDIGAMGALRRPQGTFLNWLGRHSLVFYLLHQPVILALSYGVKYVLD